MAGIGRNKRQENYEVYNEDQVGAVLQEIGIDIEDDTHTHFLVMCPFHGNNDTPAFAVDKTTGLFYCFSPSCGEAGNLTSLVSRVKGVNEFVALRLIIKNKSGETPFAKKLTAVLDDSTSTMPSVKVETVLRLHDELLENSEALQYVEGRGFLRDTIDHFKIGYSAKKGLISIPMHDVDGKPVGFIGRSIVDKVFKNSVNLPKARTCWNIHRAKRTGNVVIICEASFDAMRIHQAGFPNVVALLGGSLTELHIKQLSRFFDTFIIMTDWDKREVKEKCRKCEGSCIGHRPGRDLGYAIAEAFKNKKVSWARYSAMEIHPRWVKDAGDMTDEEIRACIYGAVSNYEYRTSGIENLAPDSLQNALAN